HPTKTTFCRDVSPAARSWAAGSSPRSLAVHDLQVTLDRFPQARTWRRRIQECLGKQYLALGAQLDHFPDRGWLPGLLLEHTPGLGALPRHRSRTFHGRVRSRPRCAAVTGALSRALVTEWRVGTNARSRTAPAPKPAQLPGSSQG